MNMSSIHVAGVTQRVPGYAVRPVVENQIAVVVRPGLHAVGGAEIAVDVELHAEIPEGLGQEPAEKAVLGVGRGGAPLGVEAACCRRAEGPSVLLSLKASE